MIKNFCDMCEREIKQGRERTYGEIDNKAGKRATVELHIGKYHLQNSDKWFDAEICSDCLITVLQGCLLREATNGDKP